MAEKRILVTGGAGFIGSNYVRYLLQNFSHKIVVLDKLSYAGNLESLQDILSAITFVQGDIGDRMLLDKLFTEQQFEILVNFAAESHVDRSILDAAPFIEANIKGVQVLLDVARRHELQRFIQISTDEVYGSIASGAFTENSPLAPNSPYAASKAAADLLCQAYSKTYRLPVIITRSSNNYGPYQFPEKLIPLMINNAINGKSMPVYGRGDNVRDWLFVTDNCRGIAAIMERGGIGEVYNIGGNCEKQNLEVVTQICRIVGQKTNNQDLESLIEFVKDRPGHDFRYALSISKLEKELAWQPTVEFNDGLQRSVDWYLQNQPWVEHIVSGEYREYYSKVYEQGWNSKF